MALMNFVSVTNVKKDILLAINKLGINKLGINKKLFAKDKDRRQGITPSLLVCASLLAMLPLVAISPLPAQAQPQKTTGPVINLSRTQLAQNISFVATMTSAPKSATGSANNVKVTQTFRVELKGKKARLDYKDASLGEVRYLINDQGTFFYIPANKAAQQTKGRIEDALELTFSRFKDLLENMKRVGTETVSGIPTIVYKDSKTGAMLYMGTHPGFRLPVKVVVRNEGGTNSFLVSQIKMNPPAGDDQFVLPKGTQVIKSEGSLPNLH